MKRFLAAVALLIVIVLGAFAVPSASAAGPDVVWLNPPANGEVHLAVGQSYTFQFSYTSDTPFNTVMALGDVYYPGRGVTLSGAQHAPGGTSGTISFTITGKRGGTSQFPGGFNPVSVNVALRFGQGNNYVENFPVQVYVP